MPLNEDTTRYTAPPDNDAEEPTYSIEHIHDHLDCWIPMSPNYRYTLDEIRDILKEAADNLTDEDYGINSLNTQS